MKKTWNEPKLVKLNVSETASGTNAGVEESNNSNGLKFSKPAS